MMVGPLLAALPAIVAAAHATPVPRTVPCDEIILHTKFPYRGYRLVLGAVSVPPAYLAQVVPTGQRPWAYWRKAGLVVRAGGPPVTISVPRVPTSDAMGPTTAKPIGISTHEPSASYEETLERASRGTCCWSDVSQ